MCFTGATLQSYFPGSYWAVAVLTLSLSLFIVVIVVLCGAAAVAAVFVVVGGGGVIVGGGGDALVPTITKM